jgi:hypothetical protein
MTTVQRITPAHEAAARGDYERAARYRAQDRERAAAAGVSAEDYVTLCVEQCRANLSGGRQPRSSSRQASLPRCTVRSACRANRTRNKPESEC